MAAVLAALLLLLGCPVPAVPLQVWIPDARTVALLFQRVLLRCRYETSAPDPPPIVTWKFLAPCAGGAAAEPLGGAAAAAAAAACPAASRPARIVATKQGGAVTVGDFYRGRGVTIVGGAELSLGPAAWGDSGLYVCTVTSTQDLEGNNEAVAELVVLGSLLEGTDLLPGIQLGTLPDWLFVLLVLGGAALVGLGLGLCWCQCCPHTCCCLLRCPCCPQRCCCPEALYLAGKAATSGGVSVTYGPPQPSIALHSLGSSHSSQVPLLRDSDGSVVSAPPAPPRPILRYLEDQINSMEPYGHYPPLKAAPPLSDVSSLHEPSHCWTPPPRRGRPPPLPSPPPASRGRWRSAEVLGGGDEEESPPPSRPRSRSRDDVVGGAETPPSQRSHGAPPRRFRKDALSRESLVV